MISKHTSGQLTILTAGSGIWNKYVEREAERKVGRPEEYKAKPAAVKKPPKPFKKMTMAEYSAWQAETRG